MTSHDPDEVSRIIAIIPQRLAATADEIDIRPILASPYVEESGHVANEWQTLGISAEFLEMGATTHGVDRDRMGEIIGLMAAAGEQLALARGALLECELWRLARVRREESGDEMCHRAIAELLSYFCIGCGHAIANVSVRLLAMDKRLHARFIDEFETVFHPLSEQRKDWISCDTSSARRLRRLVRDAFDPELRDVPRALTGLAASPAWRALDERRGADFHRRRPQSDGILGVPLQSLWKRTEGGAWMLEGGRGRYEGGRRLADMTTSIGADALVELVRAMRSLRADQAVLTSALCEGRLSIAV
jgi:hypothetical protein